MRRDEDSGSACNIESCLDELADALDEAARMLAHSTLARNRFRRRSTFTHRILAARAETNSLRLSGADRDRQLAGKRARSNPLARLRP